MLLSNIFLEFILMRGESIDIFSFTSLLEYLYNAYRMKNAFFVFSFILLLFGACNSRQGQDPGPLLDGDSLTQYQALEPKVFWEDLQPPVMENPPQGVMFLFHTSSEFTSAILSGYRDAGRGEPRWVMDSQMDPLIQARDIERAKELAPDYLIILAMDELAVVNPLKELAQGGTRIILISHLPRGFRHDIDFISLISDDLNAMGQEAARALAESLDSRGEVAVLYHHWNYFVTNSRDRSFINTIQKEYPEINIVSQQGIQSAVEAETLTLQLLQQYPDLQGIYLPWATPADGALAALRRMGRSDIAIVSYDLHQNNGLDLARGGNYAAVISDRPYQMGRAIAGLIAMDQQNMDLPGMVLFSPLRVSSENLQTSWADATGTELPQFLEVP